MAVSRQINMRAVREDGGEMTMTREFIGIKSIVMSFFMTTLAIVNREPDFIGRGKFYITSRHSYYVFYKENKNV